MFWMKLCTSSIISCKLEWAHQKCIHLPTEIIAIIKKVEKLANVSCSSFDSFALKMTAAFESNKIMSLFLEARTSTCSATWSLRRRRRLALNEFNFGICISYDHAIDPEKLRVCTDEILCS